MKSAGRVSRADWYVDRWTRAAESSGWQVLRRTGDALQLFDGCRSRWVKGPDVGLDLHVNFRIAGSGPLSSVLFSDAHIPVPPTSTHDVARPAEIMRRIKRHPGSLVVKPAAGTGGGAGVTVGPRSTRTILRSISDAAAQTRKVLLQEHVPGRVLRVLVLDGEVLDVVERRPASVRGDGSSTIRQLIAAENARRKSLGPLNTGFIRVGADCIAALERQDATLSTKPANEESYTVAGCSNTGSERESTRIEIGQAARAMSARAADAVGIRLAGVDLIIDDAGEPLAVLEVNGAPGLHWHVLVDGTPFDPFTAILAAASSPRTSAPQGQR